MNKSMFMIIDASSRLFFGPLSKHRIPAAIPFFGKYRLIDANLSNATSSDIKNVGIFPYSNYRSLSDHIGSGDRYDLDRRQDGIFILPPKSQSPADEEFCSFRRFNEQYEYFRRSNQEYVVITPGTLVWIVDFNTILEKHIESGADITQVVNKNGSRLFTFIMKKSKLMEYIDSYGEGTYRNIAEVYDYSQSITKGTYVHEGYAEYIRTYTGFYRASMRLLSDDIIDKLYMNEARFRTKDPINSSTYFGKNSLVSNSFISSGAIIDGTVKNSIISRRATIEKGATVINSVIMNTVKIESGAYVENAIIDKECIISSGVVIKGTKEEPFVSEKNQIIINQENPNVAILVAECSPYIKVGGLADMVGSLSIELTKLGPNVKVFLPLYRQIKKKYENTLQNDIELSLNIDSKTYHINTYSSVYENTTFVFIDLYMYFDRDKVYGYEDDPYRFGYYTYAVLEYLKAKREKIDVFHIHDWHTSLLPLFKKKYPEFNNSKTVLTIHNLNYQGETSKDLVDHFQFDYYVPGNTLNILEAGINSVDMITTVSKTYAEELKYAYFSGNLQGALIRRQSSMYGIVNGLDDKFDPQTDLVIKSRYSIDDVFEKKEINKRFLCDVCGFEYSEDMFLVGMVSRIDYIKGFDLVLDSMDELLKDDRVKIVLLGTGIEELMGRLRDFGERYQGKFKCFLDYYGTKAEYIYAGADAFLMPSRIEPCGTSQMIALKYGTVPIVRQTGGLNDTIRMFDPQTNNGNGFKFYNYDVRDLIYTFNLCKDVYFNNKEGWKRIIKNAMSSNNSFERCAKEYLNLYNLVKEERN